MKKTIFSRFLAVLLVLCMTAAILPAAFAANATTALIDTTKKGSFELYKYDMTNAEKDGVWDSSYVSTGVYDANVNATLGQGIRNGDDDSVTDLGNGETSNGYAIAGVEFTYLKVADITTWSEVVTVENVAHNQTLVLYGMDAVKSADLLAALNLTAENRYANADPADGSVLYFESNTLVDALRSVLVSNATTVKNALESYVKANGGTAMELTDADGYTAADDLDLGLYLIVETKVPEMVTNTVNPFFLSLPMTTVNGTNATNGGQEWIYDITLYPKNETGMPTLEKTVREGSDDTGKNEGSDDIEDGFAHNATGSTGDTMEYQIISTLPSITSKASELTVYTFYDKLSAGLTYTRGDVVIEFFTDTDCTNKITTWTENSGKFTVSYNPNEVVPDQESTMSIVMTEAGLEEINSSSAVYSGDVRRGYSDCTLRITYTAQLDPDNTVVIGDAGNPNEVTLTWKRTSSEFYDTLDDDCHVHTYGIDLTKLFRGADDATIAAANFAQVQFVLYNNTDKYWVKATLNEEEGIYYVDEHLEGEAGDNESAQATKFVPVADADGNGKVIIKGLEDDEYILTEVQTADGFTLLKDAITIVITASETEDCCGIYGEDNLGLLQNDPRYREILNADISTVLGLKNIPQKQLAHHLLTATATVDGKEVPMQAEEESLNAVVALTVVNTKGFDLPKTGEQGTTMLAVGGTVVAVLAVTAIVVLCLPKRKEQNAI